MTAQYDERVASTLEKVDPNRAKPKAILKENDMEIEDLDGEFDSYKEPLPEVKQTYMEAALLSLRELMPGTTGNDDDDRDLEQSFRADRLEFMMVHRELSPEEAKVNTVLKDAADVDWSIPTHEKFEDIIMGHAMDVHTDDCSELVHALSWSSVGAATGVGCFSVKTGNMDDLKDIRGTLRAIVYRGRCFESYPKRALMKSYSVWAPKSSFCGSCPAIGACRARSGQSRPANTRTTIRLSAGKEPVFCPSRGTKNSSTLSTSSRRTTPSTLEF